MTKALRVTSKTSVDVSSSWYPFMMKAVKLIASLGVSFSAALVGTMATTPNIPTWYASLEKPFFNPPNWVFGPVWTLLYVLIGVSLYLLWTHQTDKPKTHVYLIFIGQIWLNALWSLVFFGLHEPWFGLGVILLLLLSIVLLMRAYWPFNKVAAYLLVPYLLWVLFATALNLSIALLN